MKAATPKRGRTLAILATGITTWLGALLACGLPSAPEPASPNDGGPSAAAGSHAQTLGETTRCDAMATAARAFLETLEAPQRARAQLPFGADERTDWHCVPRCRAGLPLADMTPPQRRAAHALLRSALSPQGYEKATGVVELEGALGELTGNRSLRDAGGYYLAVSGELGPEAPWRWRFEGHHLSLNYAAATDALVATTPASMGANPAEVPTGPRAGRRVLADEEDLARRLLSMLDEGPRRRAVLSARAPRDIVAGADRRVRLDRREGLPAAAMSEPQRAVFLQLVEACLGNQRTERAGGWLAAVRADLDRLHLAWAGGVARSESHYCRVHSIVRDPDGDFGGDLLRQHYEAHH